MESINDGDTRTCSIDLGIDVWTKKRLSLRGIDTAEMKDKDPKQRKLAQKAKAFVEASVPPGSTIVVQTFHIDLYGRYVGDVFFMKGETDKEINFKDGEFLNQVLLDVGLAGLM